MVRISVSKQDKDTVVAVDGELVTSTLAELKAVRHFVSGVVILDLENLISADAISLAELRDWIRNGAQTRGASPYVQMLLGQTEDTDEPEGKHE